MHTYNISQICSCCNKSNFMAHKRLNIGWGECRAWRIGVRQQCQWEVCTFINLMATKPWESIELAYSLTKWPLIKATSVTARSHQHTHVHIHTCTSAFVSNTCAIHSSLQLLSLATAHFYLQKLFIGEEIDSIN